MSACVMRAADHPLAAPHLRETIDLGQGAVHLIAVALDPRLVALLLRAKERLVEQQNALVGGAQGERDDVQRAAALIARRRQQRPLGTGRVVEEVEDGARVDQRLAVGLNERGTLAPAD